MSRRPSVSSRRRGAVDPIEQINEQIESTVNQNVTAVFDDVQALVMGDQVDPPAPAATEAPPTTVPRRRPGPPRRPAALLTGTVFVDVESDGVLDPEAEGARVDTGAERIAVTVVVEQTFEVMTDANGAWSAEVLAVLPWCASTRPMPRSRRAMSSRPQLPTAGGMRIWRHLHCRANPAAREPSRRRVIARVTATHTVASGAIATLVAAASDDVIRAALGEDPHFPLIRQAAVDRLFQEFGLRISPDQLQTAQQRLRSNPLRWSSWTPIPGPDAAASDAAGEIVATFLQANYLVDEAATEDARAEAAEAVPDVMVEYVADQVIVARGVPVTSTISTPSMPTTSAASQAEADGGLLAVLGVLVGLLGHVSRDSAPSSGPGHEWSPSRHPHRACGRCGSSDCHLPASVELVRPPGGCIPDS